MPLPDTAGLVEDLEGISAYLRQMGIVGYEVTDRAAKVIAGLTRTDLGERCPNSWKCRTFCFCCRLSPEELEKDLSGHYRLVSLGIVQEPVA